MSSVFASAAGKSMASMDKLQKQMQLARNGTLLIGAGKEGLNLINDTTEAWGRMQAAGLETQAAIMKPGGMLDVEMYDKIFEMSQRLSERYANNATAYLDMVRILKNNKISEKDILGGIGEATAKLADLFEQMNPGVIAEFAARMRNDMGIPVGEMTRMMDVIARARNVGVGKTGQETVTEMNEYFSKVGLGLANLHVSGIESGSDMAALGALFMRRGISGQTVGTNFRRILDGLRDPERSGKANAIATEFGKHLEFFDKKGKFEGIENFVAQLDKLQGLNPDAIAAILKPFSGRQGLSTDFLEYLANDGLKSFNDIRKSMADQATMDEKLTKIMSGLNYQKKVFDTSWDNTKAAMGGALNDLMTNFYEGMNKTVVAIREFVQEHPRLTRMLMTFTLFASIGLILGGVAVTIKAMAVGMQLLGISTAATMGTVSAMLGPIALLAAIFSNLDLKIIEINGHMITLGEIVWNIIKPIEQLIAIAGVVGAYATNSPTLALATAGYAGEINRMDESFKNPKPIANNGGGGTINYSPVLNITGNASASTIDQVNKLMTDKAREFDRMMKARDDQNNRKKF